MKWLADENIPKGAFLRQHGEDVVAIASPTLAFVTSR